MNKSKKETIVQKKCKKIKLIVTDVDGVLTDGSRYFSDKGEILKKFHVRDGMGINILLRNGITTCIVTKERSKIVAKWGKDMNIKKIYQGVIHKEKKLSQICKEFKLKEDEIAYIGDDVNDIGLLTKTGFSAAPNDSIDQVKNLVNYTCKKGGGKGAFREISDLILSIKFPHRKEWY